MKNICICGHFADGLNSYDGQTIKTRNVYKQLLKKYGINNVSKIDTHNWKKHPFKMLISCINYSKKSSDIIILPAHKGLRVFIPLFNFFRKKYGFNLHYVVIGGWLFSLIKNNKFMKEQLKKVSYIYLENNKTINQLSELGLTNLYQMNNFKDLKISSYRYKYDNKIFNCCIFSRIEEKKGISSAINVINKLNKNGIKVNLDIYGKISNDYIQSFNNKLNSSINIKYKGTIDPNQSVETIEKYDLLLFPTKYYTEGIPGTIIDSFFSGVPVLASKWENFDEIIEENETGFSFEFENDNDFYDKLKKIIINRKQLEKMRIKCKNKAKMFTPINSLRILFKNIGD